jgi:hypothetical protein
MTPKVAEEWEQDILTTQLYKPPVGEFTIKVTGPIEVVAGFGGRVTKQIPTDKGPWRTSAFAVLREIAKAKKELGGEETAYVGHSFTFIATGEQLARRYQFVKYK